MRLGYRLLHRNFEIGGGEIDVICLDGDILVFVEVKTRSGDRGPAPIESVTAAKQRQLARLAALYLRRTHGAAPRCRFDVVEVLVRGWHRSRVRHHRDAFRA